MTFAGWQQSRGIRPWTTYARHQRPLMADVGTAFVGLSKALSGIRESLSKAAESFSQFAEAFEAA